MPPTKKEYALDDFLEMIAAPSHLTVDTIEYDGSTVTIHLVPRTVEAPE